MQNHVKFIGADDSIESDSELSGAETAGKGWQGIE